MNVSLFYSVSGQFGYEIKGALRNILRVVLDKILENCDGPREKSDHLIQKMFGRLQETALGAHLKGGHNINKLPCYITQAFNIFIASLVLALEYWVLNNFAYALRQQQTKFKVAAYFQLLLHHEEEDFKDVFGVTDFKEDEQELVDSFHHLCGVFKLEFIEIYEEKGEGSD